MTALAPGSVLVTIFTARMKVFTSLIGTTRAKLARTSMTSSALSMTVSHR
jgi:hypothetical protein